MYLERVHEFPFDWYRPSGDESYRTICRFVVLWYYATQTDDFRKHVRNSVAISFCPPCGYALRNAVRPCASVLERGLRSRNSRNQWLAWHARIDEFPRVIAVYVLCQNRLRWFWTRSVRSAAAQWSNLNCTRSKTLRLNTHEPGAFTARRIKYDWRTQRQRDWGKCTNYLRFQ